jgi:prevent-host-death family protein
MTTGGNMELSSSIKPISWVKENAAQMIRDIEDSGKSFVITQKGLPKAVVMDIAEYDEMRASLAMLRLLATSTEQMKGGQVVPMEDTLAQLQGEIDERRRADAARIE